jgi:formate hydrogenlyase subunit 6/NADH:ubiquinone oxidoreductase subunit I
MREQGKLGWFKHDITHRGITAWLLFALLLIFYFILYFPDKIGEGAQVFGASKETVKWARGLGDSLNIFEHFMRWLGAALGFTVKKWWDPVWNKWTLYGTLYTGGIVGGGIYMIRKYAHNRYQIIRMLAIMATQAIFAFSLPIMLGATGHKDYYFSYFWPLKIEYLYPENLANMPLFMVLYGVLGGMLVVPILGAFFGKRWYCAWICGCGGLANTFGEPWRQLSNKSQAAWTFEKYSIHTMLVIALATTGIAAASFALGDKSPGLQQTATVVKFLYGVFGVALLSGAVGVAFYPIGGTRVWCRFFCPMAALLGLVQKFGRYRITVKRNMCISCGMCSKYCEMGIDVRAYAQRNQSFVRASCVGCGLCAEVCPRGVLRLENKSDSDPQELTMNTFLTEGYKDEPRRKAV